MNALRRSSSKACLSFETSQIGKESQVEIAKTLQVSRVKSCQSAAENNTCSFCIQVSESKEVKRTAQISLANLESKSARQTQIQLQLKNAGKLPKDLLSVLNRVAVLYGQQVLNQDYSPIPNLHDLQSIEYVVVTVGESPSIPDIYSIIQEASQGTVADIY